MCFLLILVGVPSYSILSVKKQCKLSPTVIVLWTHNFACMNVHTKPFYEPKNLHANIIPNLGGLFSGLL